ncbi:MAG: hypothetical protein ACUVTE_07570 [Candidatus Bathycorpusculaceae bacterium]
MCCKKERKRIAEQDLKRFWRIKVDAYGKPLITYIDPLLTRSEIRSPLHMSLVPCLVLDLG